MCRTQESVCVWSTTLLLLLLPLLLLLLLQQVAVKRCVHGQRLSVPPPRLTVCVGAIRANQNPNKSQNLAIAASQQQRALQQQQNN